MTTATGEPVIVSGHTVWAPRTGMSLVGTGFTVLLVLLLAFAPVALSDPILGALEKGLVAALFALSFNLLAGQAGMLSFGHATYFAFGAFATVHAMVAIEHGALVLPTPLLPLVGAAAGLLVGAVTGYFATLRSGVYFSMVTLAIAEFFYTIAPNLKGMFGGETGISSFRQPFGPWSFGSDAEVYGLTLAWVVLSALLLFGLGRTLFGRVVLALRENDRRLPALGYDVHRTKVVIFAVSGLFSGLAGGLLAIQTESANYVLFHISISSAVVLNTMIGGTSIFLGPAFGAMAITLFGFVTSDATHMWLLYQGLIFISVMLLAPKGLTPLVMQAFVRMAASPRTLPQLLAVLGGIALTALGTVMLVELLSAICDRDYQLQRHDGWPAVTVLGHAWPPAQPLTWAVPLALIAAGIITARLIAAWQRDAHV